MLGRMSGVHLGHYLCFRDTMTLITSANTDGAEWRNDLTHCKIKILWLYSPLLGPGRFSQFPNSIRDRMYISLPLINCKNDLEKENNRRIIIGNKCYNGMLKLMKSQLLKRKTKCQVYKTIILASNSALCVWEMDSEQGSWSTAWRFWEKDFKENL
jgi:hypothetical protein